MGMTWTEEQKKVIDTRGCNILVSAAAGSGKTAVLVERIIKKITDAANPVDIDRLLVVTFTHAAAAEMKERIGAALDSRMMEDSDNLLLERQSSLLRSAQITTIHSFCLYVIRNHFNEIDLDPSFRIADEMELTLMRADTMEKVLEAKYEEGSEAFLDFVECYAKGKTDESIETMILQLYTYSRSYPWPKLWLDECLGMLDIQSADDFYKTPVIISLMADIKNILKDLETRLLLGAQICQKPDGPHFYEEAVLDDLAWVRRLLKCETLNEYRHALDKFERMPLSRKRMPDVSDENKQFVKAIRDYVKTMLEKLQKDYFYADEQVMLKDIRRTVAPMRELLSIVHEFSEQYQKCKAAKNVLDFGDLEHFALDILLKRDADGRIVPSAAARALADRFDEVLCDEYQDSNLVQETILKAVSKEAWGGFNRFMVGDVKQSIYKFRLARPELFMEKYKTYTTDDGGQALRIDLHKNFRSRGCVVDFVNFIFEHIMGEALGGIAYDKEAALYCGASFPEYEGDGFVSNGTEVILVDVSEDDSELKFSEDMTAKSWEAKAVADRIHSLMREGMQVLDNKSGKYRPLQYKDIVILLRTMSGYAESFADILERESIPVHTEISAGFFDTLEIRTMVALLSIIDNPRQDIALAAVLKSCLFEFSDEDLAMIRAVSKQTSFYDACKSFISEETDGLLETLFDMEVCENLRYKLKCFMDMLEGFRQCVSYMSIHKLILKIYEETNYYNLISAMPLGIKRRANLDMLVTRAVDYEKTSYKGLFNFLRYIRRLEKYEADFGSASVLSESDNAVHIMSIHKSKGLEYPVVFLGGMSKRFNQQDARSSLLIHSEFGLGPEAVDSQFRVKCPTIIKNALSSRIIAENLGEELRILYVALTRAKERLILTGVCENIGQSFEKWQQAAETSADSLAYADLIGASSYLDWVMPVILNSDWQKPVGSEVTVSRVTINELILNKGVQAIGSHLAKEGLLNMPDTLLEEEYEKLFDRQLKWEYPHKDAVRMHAKMTVSELKQMAAESDEVPADDCFIRRLEQYRSDDIRQEEALPETNEDDSSSTASFKERMAAASRKGTAVHKLMELVDFDSIHSLSDVEDYIQSLTVQGILDVETAKSIRPWPVFSFFRSSLSKRMAAAAKSGKLYRERQFMLGIEAKDIFETDCSETILVQGVIDACFEEDGGLVIIDYKTDYVKDEAVLIERYKNQLEYYGRAAMRLMNRPVKEKYIYSFALNKAILVSNGVER